MYMYICKVIHTKAPKDLDIIKVKGSVTGPVGGVVCVRAASRPRPGRNHIASTPSEAIAMLCFK